MRKNKINTPELYFIDRTKSENNFEFALVEYIDGCDFDNLITVNPEKIKLAFNSLRESIEIMHNIKRTNAGTLDNPLNSDFSSREYILYQAKKDIDYLVNNYVPIKDMGEEIYSCLSLLFERSQKHLTIHLFIMNSVRIMLFLIKIILLI